MNIGVGQSGGTLLDARVEFGLRTAQLLLGAPPHRHIGAERQAWHRYADHEGQQQQKDSLSPSCPNGPAWRSVAQIAKPVRISATVAVSRGPRQSAAHTSGRIARKPSGLVYSDAGSIGLKAMNPTATAKTSTAAAAQRIRACQTAPAGSRPQNDDRRHHQCAGDVAQPPGDPDRAKVLSQLAKPARHNVITPIVGLINVADADADQREFRHPRRGREKVSLPPDQRAIKQTAGDRFQRIAKRDHRRGLKGSGGRGVGGEGADKDRRPDFRPAQKDGGQRQPGRRPDRAGARIDGGKPQAKLGQEKISKGDNREGRDGTAAHYASPDAAPRPGTFSTLGTPRKAQYTLYNSTIGRGVSSPGAEFPVPIRNQKVSKNRANFSRSAP